MNTTNRFLATLARAQKTFTAKSGKSFAKRQPVLVALQRRASQHGLTTTATMLASVTKLETARKLINQLHTDHAC